MKKKVQVTVCFPVSFEIEIDTDEDIEHNKDNIKDKAEDLLIGSDSYPIITDCSIEDYLE